MSGIYYREAVNLLKLRSFHIIYHKILLRRLLSGTPLVEGQLKYTLIRLMIPLSGDETV